MIRIYYSGELQAGHRCVLPPPQAHHAVRVLRLKAGDSVVLFNGDGAEYTANISELARERVALDIIRREAPERESPLAVTLAQAVSSGERMDYTVQKAVELGAARIQPLTAERSVVRLQGERAAKRAAHWQAVVVASCEQCGRNCLPPVLPLLAFDDYLAGATGRQDGMLRLMLAPRSPRRLRDVGRPAGPIVLLAGPEGGFSAPEEQAAEQAGFLPVRLGPRVLRTETAAVAALAAMQAWWGDF